MSHHEIFCVDGLNHYPHAGACAAVLLFTSVWPDFPGYSVERQVGWCVTTFCPYPDPSVHTVSPCFCVNVFIHFRRVRENPNSVSLASSRLSVRMEQLGSHWADFHEFWYLSFFFRKSGEKIKKFYYNPARMIGILHEDLQTFMTVSRWIILRMRNVSDKSCRENQNTYNVQ